MTDAPATDAVDGMLEDAARRLAGMLDNGCMQGCEHGLAREIYEQIPQSSRPGILRRLIHDLVADITIGGVNLLDEDAQGTCQLASEITDKLAAAVHGQGRADRSLLRLITHEIIGREHVKRTLRQMTA